MAANLEDEINAEISKLLCRTEANIDDSSVPDGEMTVLRDTDYSNLVFKKTEYLNQIYVNCDFRDSRFYGVGLNNVVFIDCNLDNTSFVAVNFSKVGFIRTTTRSADFSTSYFSGCGLLGCNCTHANFGGITFDKGILKGVNFAYADFGNALITNTLSQKCCFDRIKKENANIDLTYIGDERERTGEHRANPKRTMWRD